MPDVSYFFGPVHDLSVDAQVGDYLLRAGPTDEEKQAMREFLTSLRTGPLPAGKSVSSIGPNVWLLSVANHIIELRLVSPSSAVITAMYRDITSGALLRSREAAQRDVVVDSIVILDELNAASLMVTKSGSLTTKNGVYVSDADVAGYVHGLLHVSDLLIVRGSGKISGEARCRRLQVEDGGTVLGTVKMLTENDVATPTTNKAAEHATA